MLPAGFPVKTLQEGFLRGLDGIPSAPGDPYLRGNRQKDAKNLFVSTIISNENI